MTRYDGAETWLLNFDTELPDPEGASATHIGFHLAWVLNTGLAAPVRRQAHVRRPERTRQSFRGALLRAAPFRRLPSGIRHRHA
jgi:hypothetical protein